MGEQETAVFAAAVERLDITAENAEQIFKVSPEVFSAWKSGANEIPKAAFIALLNLENTAAGHLQERIDDINRIAAMLKPKPAPATYRRTLKRKNKTHE